MNTRIPIKKIDYAIRFQPDLIPILFKDTSIPKGLLYSRLRRAVPHSVGIEFEGVNEFIVPWYKDHKHLFKSKLVYDQDVANYFGVMKIECDHPLISIDYDHTHDPIEPEIEEVRVRILNFTQLNGLSKVLTAMSNYMELPDGGGIHIHIDLSDYITNFSSVREVIKNYLTNHLDEIESIFPKYTGKYNKRKVGNLSKGTWVNVSNKNTLEFRIAPLTFDYKELINWIIGCSKITSEVINRCHLKKIDFSHDNSIINHTSADHASIGGDLTQMQGALRNYIRQLDNARYICYSNDITSNCTTFYNNSSLW